MSTEARTVSAHGLTLTPTTYTASGPGIPTGDHPRVVTIEARRQRNGSTLWAVCSLGDVLNSSGEWEWEPLPSSRTDAFMRRTRFRSLDDAAAVLARSLATPTAPTPTRAPEAPSHE